MSITNLSCFRSRCSIFTALAFLVFITTANAAWVPVGPFGGDVRSLTADPSNPDRIYLGTRIGQIYLTTDGGKRWNRLTAFHAPADWVVDSLSIDAADSNVIYAGMWSLSGTGGGIYKSGDKGATWNELSGMTGQSIRSLAVSSSASNVVVAGSLEGVFRSENNGESWKQISPPGHEEIRNVESLAIDPRNPEIIYIGTWHLPWKTSDGGAHWEQINRGIVDDSDMFSIVIDATHPQTLYASACSGIYKTDTAGAAWRKIHGIPYSSRRTRVLALDPRNPQTVYAGTTEGLWISEDGGETWKRPTPANWIINDIVVDARNSSHVYLGLDDIGVMESGNGGANFEAANTGFSQRLVSRIVSDPGDNGRFYASLVQDGQSGGVLVTENNGGTWQAVGSGLGDKNILSLLVVSEPSWKLLAGTPEGIFEYSKEDPVWQNKSHLILPAPASPPPTPRRSSARKLHSSPKQSVNSPAENELVSNTFRVWDLYRRNSQEPIYAATSAGLLKSSDSVTWTRLPLYLSRESVSQVVSAGENGNILFAITSYGLKMSRDSGQIWDSIRLDSAPESAITRIAAPAAKPNLLFAASSTGVFRSLDAGATWEKFGHGIPFSPVREIAIAPNDIKRVLVVGDAGIFQSVDGGNRYSRLDDAAGIENLRIQRLAILPAGNHPIFAASPSNGIFIFDRVPPQLE